MADKPNQRQLDILRQVLQQAYHNRQQGGRPFAACVADEDKIISHGLNSEHILFSVMVEGVDGKFRNDIVPVEELDFNSFRIELAEARRVKVAVRAMTALA